MVPATASARRGTAYRVEAHNELVLVWIGIHAVNLLAKFHIGLKEVRRGNEAPDT